MYGASAEVTTIRDRKRTFGRRRQALEFIFTGPRFFFVCVHFFALKPALLGATSRLTFDSLFGSKPAGPYHFVQLFDAVLEILALTTGGFATYGKLMVLVDSTLVLGS